MTFPCQAFFVDDILDLINLWCDIVIVSANTLEICPSFLLLPSPYQPDRRLRQPPGEDQEDEGGDAGDEVEILDGDYEAETEADQLSCVYTARVEAVELISAGDGGDLREEGVAGDHHHARDHVGERHCHYQGREGGAEVDAT